MFKHLVSLLQTKKQAKMDHSHDRQARIVYVQDCHPEQISKLYQLDLSTGKAELVGNIANDVYDLAAIGSQLYGLEQQADRETTQLVTINPDTGETTVVGDIGFYVVGLAYRSQDDTLYASAEKKLIL